MAYPSTLSSIPFVGSGVGYRGEIRDGIWEHREAIDCVEVITDRYTESPAFSSELEELRGAFHVIPHGIGLSIGSPEVDMAYLEEVRRVTRLTRATYYSEHLCMTRGPGIDIGHLAPLWFSEEVLANTIANVDRVQGYLGLPLILENTTYPFVIPDADMSQTEFFHRLVKATGCGILLDITNVRVNAVNHGFDPVDFLDQMPLDHVVQLHTSGGYVGTDGDMIDGHCRTPDDEVWRLIEAFAARAQVKGSILEHDEAFPDDFSLLLNTVTRTREVLGWPSPAAGGAAPTPASTAAGR